MAFEKRQESLSFIAASAVNMGQPVALLGAVTPGSAVDLKVVPAASLNIDAIGIARATQATVGLPVQVVVQGVAKVLAGASIGQGARIAVGSTNGVVAQSALGAVASNVKFAVGRALVNAAAGDYFSIWVHAEQIV